MNSAANWYAPGMPWAIGTLFYRLTASRLVIASEPWAVAAADPANSQPDEVGAAYYFTFTTPGDWPEPVQGYPRDAACPSADRNPYPGATLARLEAGSVQAESATIPMKIMLSNSAPCWRKPCAAG